MAIPSTEVNKEKEQIRNMFDEISETYDRLNHFLSFSIDKYWRKRTICEVSKTSAKWLDVSTGTADLAILAAKKKNAIVTGVDISENMLSIGKEKVKTLQLESRIELKKGDAEQLPFNENLFDVCSVAFGVRNFENLDKGLQEMYRCLKPGGEIVILEFSTPKRKIVQRLYTFYIKNILPMIGKLVSKNRSAYTYLPDSIHTFCYGKAFLDKLSGAGFKNVKQIPLTFGVATIYKGLK